MAPAGQRARPQRAIPDAGADLRGVARAYLGWRPSHLLFGMSLYSLRVYHALYGAMTVLLTFWILDRVCAAPGGGVRDIAFGHGRRLPVGPPQPGMERPLGLPFVLGATWLLLRQPAKRRQGRSPAVLRAVDVLGRPAIRRVVLVVFRVFFALPAAGLLFLARRRLSRRNAAARALGWLAGVGPYLFALASVYHASPWACA